MDLLPTPDEAPADDELVTLAARGDRAAFTALVERNQERIYAVAFRLLRDGGEAEEVVQEAFLAAYEKLPTFRGEAAFSTWLFRVAANAALMRLRKRRTTPMPAEAALDEDLPHFDPSGRIEPAPRHDWSKRADEQVADHELRRAIADAVANLPDDYRIVFLLRDVEGLSNDEMAAMLGLSVAGVKSRLHRARLVLRGALGRFLE